MNGFWFQMPNWMKIQLFLCSCPSLVGSRTRRPWHGQSSKSLLQWPQSTTLEWMAQQERGEDQEATEIVGIL